MPIIQSELKLYKSATVSDSATNGGRMSANEITSGAAKNVFPVVGEAERTAGSLKYRKVYPKVTDSGDIELAAPKVYLDQYTAGDDIVMFFVGTQTDIQDDITGSEKQYGAGKLDANASATDTEIDVLVEDGGDHPFEDGDLIRITDKTDIDDVGGAEEYITIVGTPSVLGDVVTITFTPALANAYSASAARVMNVYEPASDVVATADGLTVTSAAGTFEAANLLAHNIGSVEQDWIATFASATTFGIVGDTLGSVGSGSIGAGAAPNNPDFGAPYFTLQAAGFGGTFLAGDTIEFSTHPAAVPVWMKRLVPAGAAALTVNNAVLVLDGETSG
jgi:hypothetical protein